MENNTKASWEKFLNPKTLKTNLIKCSIYIVFFEKLKEIIIEKIKDFYFAGFENGKDLIDDEYKERFYKQGVDIFDESLNWLVENEAINRAEKQKIIELKKHRNEIAHEMINFIASSEKEVKETLLVECYEILSKIDKWWIIEVELTTNPDFMQIDHNSIEHDSIFSGNMALLQLLYKVYIGDDKSLENIYNKIINIPDKGDKYGKEN